MDENPVNEVMDELITVRGTQAKRGFGGEPVSHVAFFERDPAHPGGEVWLMGGQEGQVARTWKVAQAVRKGLLVVVE